MAWCNFHLDESQSAWVCRNPNCGYVYKDKTGKPPRRKCTGNYSTDFQQAADKLGVTLDELKHYGTEVFRWLAAECPVRTDAEVAACLAACHEPCEHYREGRPPVDSENPPGWLTRVAEFVVSWRKKGYCAECGCGLSDGRFPLINAVRMKTFLCKHGKWPT